MYTKEEIMYCNKCGAEVMEEAVICTKCGCYVNNMRKTKEVTISGLKTAAKVFMIIGCVLSAFWLISLVWTIPMTVSYSNKINSGEQVGIGFKICTLLFVNFIAGILMLCDND